MLKCLFTNKKYLKYYEIPLNYFRKRQKIKKRNNFLLINSFTPNNIKLNV